MRCLAKFIIIVTILSLTGSGFCLADELAPAKLLISEVQIVGANGEEHNDYIKIYNPNDQPINLKEYKLVKRTNGSITDNSIKSWTSETIIASLGYHTWANSENNFAVSINADSFTQSIISPNNGIAIIYKADNTIIDSMGWGDYSGNFLEGSAPRNPVAGEKLTRLNNQDSNNNKTDFPLPDLTDPPADQNNNEPIPIVSTSTGGSGGSIVAYDTTVVEITEVVGPPPPETKIYISEILPDPAGLDIDYSCYSCGEFIELYNDGIDPVDLKNWQIQVDQQPIYTINHFLPLLPGQYFVLYRSKTGLILNNRQGEIKLYKLDSQTAWQSVKYKTAPENASYNLEKIATNSWQWSKLITPGKVNTINYAPVVEFYFNDNVPYTEAVAFDASDSFDPDNELLSFNWDFGDGQTSTQANPTHSYKYPGDYTVILKASDGLNETIKKQAIKIAGQVTLLPEALKIYAEQPTTTTAQQTGTSTADTDNRLSAKGVVVVLPNTYGSQYFYILPMRADETVENQALQIYSYYKAFPMLALGDYIEAQGEVSETSDGPRLKIKDINDIKILDHDYIVVEREIKTDQINDQLKNQLVAISGQISDKEGQNIFLQDQVAEGLIYLSTGSNLKASDFSIGQSYRVTGLVRQMSGQLKIMPRSSQDISPITPEMATSQPATEVLGEKITETPADIVLPAQNEQQKILEYILIAAGFIIIVLVLYIFQQNKKTS